MWMWGDSRLNFKAFEVIVNAMVNVQAISIVYIHMLSNVASDPRLIMPQRLSSQQASLTSK